MPSLTHNEALSVPAMRVSNKDCSSAGRLATDFTCCCLLRPLVGGCDVICFLMRRIIFTSFAVITLIAISAYAWVGAGERLSLFLDRFKTMHLASLPTRPL